VQHGIEPRRPLIAGLLDQIVEILGDEVQREFGCDVVLEDAGERSGEHRRGDGRRDQQFRRGRQVAVRRAQNVAQLPSDGELRGEQTVDRELGARLFERSSRRVTLTSAGAELLPRARALLEQADEGRPTRQRTVIRLPELRGDPLVVQRPESEADTTAIYLNACAEAGLAAPVAQYVTSLQALLGFVAAGLGWAFVAQSLVGSLRRADVSFVSVRGTAPGCQPRWPGPKASWATRPGWCATPPRPFSEPAAGRLPAKPDVISQSVSSSARVNQTRSRTGSPSAISPLG
jgi:hypothetical protein